MFYIPKFETLEDLLEYEKKFLEKYKKSINSGAFMQMQSIKAELDRYKKEFLSKNIENDKDDYQDILNIG